MEILHNHIGFNPSSCKTMIVQGTGKELGADEMEAELLRIDSDERVLVLKPTASGAVPGWKDRYFWQFDFSDFTTCGKYRFVVHGSGCMAIGVPFAIDEHLMGTDMISDVLSYFKGQRCSGRWDEADRKLPFHGDRNGTVDAHGGWFDASGDYSKYLSHLSYANYLNPQQTPLTVWVLLQLGETIRELSAGKTTLLEERAFEEAWWGADFLMRMQDPQGYFYMTVFDTWNKKNEDRMICTFKTQKGHRLESYQSGFRQGGGMAIAALARASRFDRTCIPQDGYPASAYLEAAVKGYDHLKEHNEEYLDNGKENIIDCYCALVAALELFLSTGEARFLSESRAWNARLISHYDPGAKGWMAEVGSKRPFYHASDSGLIPVAMMHYLSVEPDDMRKAQTSAVLLESLRDELSRAESICNPFGMSRQLVRSVHESDIRASFFVPHENESGYWWQGENARIASMASAARLAVLRMPDLIRLAAMEETEAALLSDRLRRFADAHVDWILGCNPFDCCMLHGYGRNNPRYEVHAPNAPGGICNGITGGFFDEQDIDFLPEALEGRSDHRWRWSEQWIPHATWFLMALALRVRLQ